MSASPQQALQQCIAALTSVQELNVELDYSALTSKASREIAEAKAAARQALQGPNDTAALGRVREVLWRLWQDGYVELRHIARYDEEMAAAMKRAANGS